MSGIPVFTAPYYQRGHGLGAALGVFRSAVPFLKPMLKSVGKSVLAAGTNIAKDVMSGKKLSTAMRSHVQTELGKGVKRGLEDMLGQTGSGAKRRRCAKRPKKKTKKKPSRKPIKRKRTRRNVISKRTAKRKRRVSDIFD